MTLFEMSSQSGWYLSNAISASEYILGCFLGAPQIEYRLGCLEGHNWRLSARNFSAAARDDDILTLLKQQAIKFACQQDETAFAVG